jgi:hypothetical protein
MGCTYVYMYVCRRAGRDQQGQGKTPEEEAAGELSTTNMYPLLSPPLLPHEAAPNPLPTHAPG